MMNKNDNDPVLNYLTHSQLCALLDTYEGIIKSQKEELDNTKILYNDLLMQVDDKFSGVSRHDVAKSFIKQTQLSFNQECKLMQN